MPSVIEGARDTDQDFVPRMRIAHVAAISVSRKIAPHAADTGTRSHDVIRVERRAIPQVDARPARRQS